MKIRGKSFETLQKAYHRLKVFNPVKAGHIKGYINKTSTRKLK